MSTESLFAEPRITINGTQLSTGQAMAVRVALEAFAMDLAANGLGTDEQGRSMADSYLSRISEIRTTMQREERQYFECGCGQRHATIQSLRTHQDGSTDRRCWHGGL